MKTIGGKISLWVFAIAGATLFCGSYAYKDYLEYEKAQKSLNASLYLRGYLKNLETSKTPLSAVPDLKKARSNMREKDRHEALSNLIQSINADNKQLMKMRFKEIEEVERKFHQSTLPKLENYKLGLAKYTLYGFLCCLAGLLLFSIYLNRSIVRPLQKLSQRMMDFLTDKYTFKFAEPSNNEIGDLQRTFNSLAQNVLNNMDELKALDRAKSEFVSIASHELRTPLTSIKGSLGLLSSGIVGALDEESKGLIRIAETETDRLVRLINNLLDLAKMESHTFTLKKEWVPVLDLAESCLETLIGLANTAQVKLEIQHPEETFEASLDRDRIHQVITNLMSNAIKYSPKNETVVLSFSITQDRKLEIAVTDRGPGIPESDQQLIFEKFRQGTQAESKLVKGTGLGLAISKALIEEHGGTLGLRSQPGKGSTFCFTIPEWRKAASQPSDKWRAAA